MNPSRFHSITNGRTDSLSDTHACSVVTHTLKKETHLVVILAGHDVGEGDLGLEHLPAVHQLDEQVAHRLKLHPLGWFDV